MSRRKGTAEKAVVAGRKPGWARKAALRDAMTALAQVEVSVRSVSGFRRLHSHVGLEPVVWESFILLQREDTFRPKKGSKQSGRKRAQILFSREYDGSDRERGLRHRCIVSAD